MCLHCEHFFVYFILMYIYSILTLRIQEVKPADSGDLAKTKKEKEPSSFTVTNPSRVVPAQIRFLSLQRTTTTGASTGGQNYEDLGGSGGTGGADVGIMDTPRNQRYIPVDITRRSAPSGIIMLIDEDPTLPEVVEKIERILIGQVEEAVAPEPFIWDPTDAQVGVYGRCIRIYEMYMVYAFSMMYI